MLYTIIWPLHPLAWALCPICHLKKIIFSGELNALISAKGLCVSFSGIETGYAALP